MGLADDLKATVDRLVPRDAVREVFTLWGVCFAGIVIAFLLSAPAAKLVATVGFLYLPVISMDRRQEDYEHFGLSTRRLGRDVLQFLAVSAVVFPLFVAGYFAFAEAYPHLPAEFVRIFTPYAGTPHFSFRLPDRFPEWVIDQVFVVALPEEFFYRGYMQARLRDAWPEGRMVFGARLGRAFWVTALLFALGHLAIFQVWRLAVFFPALIFGWMRERSSSVVGGALFHASANLLVMVLDASFFNSR